MGADVRPDISFYEINVAWSTADAEFVATCPDFPSLSWVASTRTEARQGFQNLLEGIFDDMGGEPVPMLDMVKPGDSATAEFTDEQGESYVVQGIVRVDFFGVPRLGQDDLNTASRITSPIRPVN